FFYTGTPNGTPCVVRKSESAQTLGWGLSIRFRPRPPSCCSSTLQNLPNFKKINVLGAIRCPGRLTARRYIPSLPAPQVVPHNRFVKNELWGGQLWAY